MRTLVGRAFSVLSAKQIADYHEYGFLVLPKFLPGSEVESLKTQALALINQWEPAKRAQVFTTTEQEKQNNDYFMASGENISFFLEEGAQDASGRLIRPKQESINKIAHAMHDLDPVFSRLSYRPEYRTIVGQLGYRKPVIVQSMYIMKPPGLGGEVIPHQDSTYIISKPSSCMGIWLAVEDASVQNACLYAVPGSQKAGTLKHWVKRDGKMVLTNDKKYSTDGGVCVEAVKGTVVLLHGDLVHWSSQNQSSTSRHAYTLHLVESDHCLWSVDNWLQRSSLGFKTWL